MACSTTSLQMFDSVKLWLKCLEKEYTYMIKMLANAERKPAQWLRHLWSMSCFIWTWYIASGKEAVIMLVWLCGKGDYYSVGQK